MKKKLIQIVRWVSTKGLIWLGFGATPFIFMACYGPVPRNYQEADFADARAVLRIDDPALQAEWV